MIAFLVGHLLTEYTQLSWHFTLGTSTFIAVALFQARLGMPESPRWLWSVGRKDEARALAYKYMPEDALDDVQHEDVRKGSFVRTLTTAMAGGRVLRPCQPSRESATLAPDA